MKRQEDCQQCQKLITEVRELTRLIERGPVVNARMRRCLRALAKRRDWLEERIKSRSSSNLKTGFDKTEASALRWAILALTSAARHGSIDDSSIPELDPELSNQTDATGHGV